MKSCKISCMSYKKISLMITLCFFVFLVAAALGYQQAQKEGQEIIVLSEPEQDVLSLDGQVLGQDGENSSRGEGQVDSFANTDVLTEGGEEVGVKAKNQIEFDQGKPMYPGHFYDLEGKKLGFDDFKGSYLVINFWATWCAPCVVELPTLQKLSKKFDGQGLKVMAISVDLNSPPEKLKEFIDRRFLDDLPIYMDTDMELQRNIPMRGLPTTFLVSPAGHLLRVYEGEADWGSPPAITFFHNLLNEKKS